MDFRTPCQILLGLLLATIALATLGLVADNVSYVDKHQNPSPVDIHYTRWNQTANAQYSYWVTMDYTPSRFSMSRDYLMIIASLVCCLTGAGIAVASWIMRAKKSVDTISTSKKVFLPTALILSATAFLISLAAAIYTWYPVMRWPINFLKSLPAARGVSSASQTSPLVYQSPFYLTPEIWNCQLAPYIVKRGESQRMQGLCHEASVARYLMIVVVILSAVLLSSLFWTWRQTGLAAASHTDNAEAKEVEEVSVYGKE